MASAAEGGKQRKDGGGGVSGLMDGFWPVMTPPSIFWNSRRKRSGANGRNSQGTKEEEEKESPKAPDATGGSCPEKNEPKQSTSADTDDDAQMAEAPFLTERRKALFDPLDPPPGGKRMRAEDLLPPPDFDSVPYPKGWLVGKKRKLVNVDVVESMRRIAVQEMNRKDREIDGLNEHLEEDAQCLERLQLQLLEERSKRAEVERQNAMLQNQVSMLMEMMQEAEAVEGEEYQYEAHEP